MKTLLSLLLLTSINITYAAQTCKNDLINNTPNSRYTNNNDGTITDKTTKLVWKQCPEGQTWVNGNPDNCSGTDNTMNWQAALILADNTTFAGKSDWRLPNIKELESIVSNHCNGTTLNLASFPNTPPNRFWSSTPNALFQSAAWAVNFSSGNNIGYPRTANHHMRLVRNME